MAHEPNNGHKAPAPDSLRLGYEPDSVNTRGLFWFVVIFIASALVLHLILWPLMTGSINREAKHDRPGTAFTGVRLPPPDAPPLQTAPSANLQDMYRREDETFRHMGWRVDPESHAMQIPDDVVKRVADEARGRGEEDRHRAATRPTERTGDGPRDPGTAQSGGAQ